MDKQEWYVIEYSQKGADDWYESRDNADTLDKARELKRNAPYLDGVFEYRITKKTLLSQVVE